MALETLPTLDICSSEGWKRLNGVPEPRKMGSRRRTQGTDGEVPPNVYLSTHSPQWSP